MGWQSQKEVSDLSLFHLGLEEWPSCPQITNFLAHFIHHSGINGDVHYKFICLLTSFEALKGSLSSLNKILNRDQKIENFHIIFLWHYAYILAPILIRYLLNLLSVTNSHSFLLYPPSQLPKETVRKKIGYIVGQGFSVLIREMMGCLTEQLGIVLNYIYM